MRLRKAKRGQTLVELAMILPVLLAIIMGIIDFSYYVYSWSEVQFAARRGAEQASKLPPKFGEVNSRTSCEWNEIWDEIQKHGALSGAAEIKQDEVTMSFWKDRGPTGTAAQQIDPDIRYVPITSEEDVKVRDAVIEVQVVHPIQPLTPLGVTFFGEQMILSAESRRTIITMSSPLVCQQP